MSFKRDIYYESTVTYAELRILLKYHVYYKYDCENYSLSTNLVARYPHDCRMQNNIKNVNIALLLVIKQSLKKNVILIPSKFKIGAQYT